MVTRAVDFPRTHDLALLARHVRAGSSVELEPSELLSLNRYSTEARYPGDWDPITRIDAEQALATALQIRLVARAHLPESATR